MSHRRKIVRSSDPSDDHDHVQLLPEDVLIDILLRMPPKFIAVFRTLSKYCKELMDSDEFSRKHRETLTKIRTSVILYHKFYRHPQSVVMQLEFESGFRVDQITAPFDDEWKGKFNKCFFLGCHMGILCYIADGHLGFWNPITRVVRRSQCADTISRRTARGRDLYVRYLSGYDHVADDFKVVKITRIIGNASQHYVYDSVIYSSKTDSWTRVSQGFDHMKDDYGRVLALDTGGSEYVGTEAFLNGRVHMFAAGRNCVKVVAYDFTTDKFNIVPLPHRNCGGMASLSPVDGCLCLINSHQRGNIEGWSMKDYGVVESWHLLFTIQPHSLTIQPPGGVLVIPLAVHGRTHLLVHPEYAGSERPLHLYDVHRKQFDNALLDTLDDVSNKQLNRVLKDQCSLKQKRPNEGEPQPFVKTPRTETPKQLVPTIADVGPPADWVKINVRETKDCFEVYALVPGLLREEVRVQSDPAGRLVITGQPEQTENPWGITSFRKVVSLPGRIDPLGTSAVVSLHGRLYVRVPFEQQPTTN